MELHGNPLLVRWAGDRLCVDSLLTINTIFRQYWKIDFKMLEDLWPFHDVRTQKNGPEKRREQPIRLPQG
jgi:hypothetical protein